MTNNGKAQEILGWMYPSENIYLIGVGEYSPKQITVTFCVPTTHSTYTQQSLGYVSTEQYIRCISQGGYVFLGLLAKSGLSPIDSDVFRQLMTSCRMWYRSISLRFKKQSLKGENFELTLQLEKVREIGDFFSCTLRVEGPVVGDVEFVAPKT